uniref:SAP domain-containing protein n=1 Tax=Taeniopygia guttata TaxID=59729 RepID=A0A674GQE8_TAEGU
MADGEEVTLDGRPLHLLRVADLKAALEQRGLAKSGQKSALIKRLRGALMLENLQKHSSPHPTFQPNSQVRPQKSPKFPQIPRNPPKIPGNFPKILSNPPKILLNPPKILSNSSKTSPNSQQNFIKSTQILSNFAKNPPKFL